MAQTTILAIEHIVKTPGVVGGKPRIAGRRLPVHHIVYAYDRQGATVEELVEAFDLTPAQIYAAMAYYHDNREEIDRLIADDDAAVAAIPPENAAMREELRRRLWERYGKDPFEELTVTEVAGEYGISPQAVRKACANTVIPARKSGAIWLIRRHIAEARWGKKRDGK
jgi:uncharacterized protein (DUF433 family)